MNKIKNVIIIGLLLSNGFLFAGKKKKKPIEKDIQQIQLNNKPYLVDINPPGFFQNFSKSEKKGTVDISLYTKDDEQVGCAQFSDLSWFLEQLKNGDRYFFASKSFAHTNVLKIIGNSSVLIELDIFQIYSGFTQQRIGREFLLYTLQLFRKKYPGACVVLKANPFGVNPTSSTELCEHYGKCGFKYLLLDKEGKSKYPKRPHLYIILDNSLNQDPAINFSKIRLNQDPIDGSDIQINYLKN